MADGEHFRFDVSGGQHPNQPDRSSPPALDEGYGGPEQSPKSRLEKLFLPRQGSVDYSRFEKILKKAREYNTISELPYHIREDVGDHLNIVKESRSDWRGVASRMHLKPTTIDKIEKKYKDNPTEQLFQEVSGEKTTQLVQVLYQMGRNDVLNVFFENLCIESDDDTQHFPAGEKREQFKSSKFPSQESTPVSSNSSTSEFGPITPKSPFKDSGTPESADRSDSGLGSTRSQPTSRTKTSIAKQNTDEDLRSRSSKSPVNFHSQESKQFWYGIPPRPTSTRKEWKEVEEAFKKDFEKESRLSQVMRFICYVLKIEPYEERHNKFVHDQDFANLVAWFGPVKSGKGGLFAKIEELIKGSTTYKDGTGPHSFFAGYMTKGEADAKIEAAEQVGTFLIRFSSTFAEEGSFVVVLKTQNGAEHIPLEGNLETGKITYKDKEYDDLITLYRRGLCRGGVSSNKRVSCTTICPHLPLNAMFKPYGPAPRSSSSLGRGRGRGRSQEQ